MSAQIQIETPSSLTSGPVSTTGVLARSTYDQLRACGLSDTDIMEFTGELLSLVASEVSRRPAKV